MNASRKTNDDGKGGAAIAGLVMIFVLVGIYYATRAGKKAGGGDGGDDDDSAGPAIAGGLGQTQEQIIIPGAGNVELDPNTPYRNNWAAIIDMLGSTFLDSLRNGAEARARAIEDAKARAADAKATVDAQARNQFEAKKADAEGKARGEADKALTDLDGKPRPPVPVDADGKAAVDAQARNQIDSEKTAAEGKVRGAADKALTDLDGKPPPIDVRPPPDADANAKARAAIESESANAQAAEEEYARTAADERVRGGDTAPRRTAAPEVRRAMSEKTQSFEADTRNGANTKILNEDFVDATRAEVDKGRTKVEIDTHKKTNAQALQLDADARVAADARAAAAAAAEVQQQARNALDADAKARAEEKIRTKASATADGRGSQMPSLLRRYAANQARGVLGSAETTKIVEMGQPARDPITGLIDPELRSHPLDYNGIRSSSWGKMPSEVMKRSSQFIRNVGAKIAQTMAKNPTTQSDASAKAMLDSKVMARGSKEAAKQAGMAVLDVIGKLDFASDVMMIVQVFCDSFFYLAFPDESTLITPKTVKGIQEKSVKAQIDSTTLYNKDLVIPVNATLVGFKYAQTQWPVIIGPLDDPTKHRSAPPSVAPPKYPEYENQMRVQAEIDAVREKLLRTTFKDYWVECFNQPEYDTVTSNVADALVNYVEDDSFLNARSGFAQYNRADELYRQAFSSVCLYHGGIMFEDVRPTADSHWRGRPRFQCSWPTMHLCEASSNDWIDTDGRNGDNYGEWYTFDELNTSLSNITGSGTGIVGCHGTDKTSYRSACGIETTHPLRKGGKTGACIISTPAVASICRKNKGTYVSAEHRCVFSEEYCQSIGTCFDRVEKMCYLPGEAMHAVSMIFGTGGPREWIKINGCNFASTPEEGFYDIINVTPLGLYTKEGQTFMADMFANHKNWNEGMKRAFGEPTTIAAFASMAVMHGIGTKKGSEFLENKGGKYGVRKGYGRQTGLGLLLMGIAIGISIGVSVLDSQEEQNKGPPDPEYGPYVSEYTVGGWDTDTGAPLTLGFNNGWVTRPIKAHTLADWPQTLTPPAKNIPTQPTLPTNVQGIPSNVTQKRFYSSYNLDGALTAGIPMSTAVKTYTQTKKPPVSKVLCYTENKIRAGARATDNELFCMDPFPPVTYADTTNIGQLAPDEALTANDTSRSYMTSRTWTDGKDPTTPQYPFDAVKDNTPKLWFYQLVYDKHNMVGMTSVTEDGVTYKKGYPKELWNTELLQFYFLDSTIQEMRQYYCVQGLIDKPDGSFDATTKIGVDPKCWGYLNVSFPGYKYIPMTLPGINGMSSAAQAVLTAAPPPTNEQVAAAAVAAAAAADLVRAGIAKSIPAPQMITIFQGMAIYSRTLDPLAIGDSLSDASITALGFDATKKPVKKIDKIDHSGSSGILGWTAVISPIQTRRQVPYETNRPELPGTVIQTTLTGTWPTDLNSDYSHTYLQTLVGRLNLATLLA